MLAVEVTLIFNPKEHRFILVFNVCLHGDNENNHKNANELQSEAFQKCIENGLRADAKNGKMLLVIANGHVTITFFGCYTVASNAKRSLEF